jgi:hypothetical protein
MPLPVMGIIFRDASSSAFSSVLATTLRIYLLEVDLVNVPVHTSMSTVHYEYWHSTRLRELHSCYKCN